MKDYLKFVGRIKKIGVDFFFALYIDRKNNYPRWIAKLTEGIDDPVEKRQFYLHRFENGCRKVL